MAGHKARKTVLLALLEELVTGDLAYGSTAYPIVSSLSGSMAVNVIDPSLDPIVGDYKDLNYVRDVMGNSPRIQASRHSSLSFKTPFSPAFAANGTVPAWGALLRMCGFAQTTDNFYSVYPQLTTQANIGATVLYVQKVSDLVVGDKLNMAGYVPNGTTISAINGTTKAITLSAALTAAIPAGARVWCYRDTLTATTNAISASGTDSLGFASAPDVPAGTAVSGTGIPSGTYVVSRTATKIYLSKAVTSQVASGASITFDYRRTYYNSVSSGHEYGTMACYMDKIKHALAGVRGNVKITASAGELPMFDFNFLGLYSTPEDGAPSGVSYNRWKDPLPVNSVNTYIAYAGAELNIKQFEVDIANEVVYRNLVNAEDVQIIDRKTTGSISWECDSIAAQNWFDWVNQAKTGSLVFRHGTAAGGTVQLVAEKMSMHDLKYTVENGVYFFTASLAFTPNDGNDDIIIEAC